jgi:hypothetical protein
MVTYFKNAILIFGFLCCGLILQAQPCFTLFEWMKPDTNTTSNNGAIAYHNGFVYNLGHTLQKLDTLGNLIWEKPAQGNRMQIDGNGEIIITGYAYAPNVLLDTVTLSFVPSDGYFLAKFDANGNYLWASKFSSTTSQNYFREDINICTDFANNIYMIDNANGLLKLSPTGTIIWTKQVNSNNGCDVKYSVLDSTIVIGGIYSNYNPINNIDSSFFIQKLDLASNIIFTKRFVRNDIYTYSYKVIKPRLYVNATSGQIFAASSRRYWYCLIGDTYEAGLLMQCNLNGLNDSIVTGYGDAISNIDGNNDSLIFVQHVDDGMGPSSASLQKRNTISNVQLDYCLTTEYNTAPVGNSLYIKCRYSNQPLLAKMGNGSIPLLFINNQKDTMCTGKNYANPILINANPNGYTYSWSPSQGVNDTTLRSPIFAPTFTTNYSLSIIDTMGLITNTNLQVLVYPKIIITASLSQSQICPGDSIQITGNGLPNFMSTNKYNFPVNSSISNFFKPAFSDIISLFAKDSNNCIWSDAVFVEVHTFNINQSIIQVPNSREFCIGDTAMLTNTNGLSSIWSGGIINGVSFTPTASQTFTLQLIDTFGCAFKDSVSFVNRSDTAINNIFPGNDTALCNVNNYSLHTASTNNVLTWKYNNAIISSVNNCNVPIGSAGQFILVSTNGYGCKNQDSVFVQNNALPKPIIIKNNTHLICSDSTFSSYQWYFNNLLIGSSFSVAFSQVGIYKLIVKDSIGCTAANTIVVATPSNIINRFIDKINIYPNPITDGFTNIKLPFAGNKKIIIYNSYGQKMLEYFSGLQQEKINVKDLASGLYLLCIVLENGEIYKEKIQIVNAH